MLYTTLFILGGGGSVITGFTHHDEPVSKSEWELERSLIMSHLHVPVLTGGYDRKLFPLRFQSFLFDCEIVNQLQAIREIPATVRKKK